MKRAVIYLRVSTERQARMGGGAEGYSIPSQRQACERAAADLDATVVEEYVDAGESARAADRPQLQALLDRLQARQDVDYVIVHKIDRLARNRHDDARIALQIHEAGAALISATENIDQTPSGKLLHGIMATIAEFYSSNLANEAKKGLVQKAKEGGTPGYAPIGYLNTIRRTDGHEIRTVEPDPERAEHVTWAFEAFASGQHTLTSLTEALEDRGLRTRRTRKFASKPLQRSKVHTMLRNRYYIGIVHYAGVDYDGMHKPLIDIGTFQLVQDILDAHRQSGERSYRHQHYLKGSLFCGHCRSMIGLTHTTNRHGTRYAYFYCIGRQHKRTNCNEPYLATDAVEEAVENYYRTVQLTPTSAGGVRDSLVEEIERTQRLARRDVKRQKKTLTRLDHERRTLLQAHYAGAVPLDLLKDEQARIQREQARAEDVISSCHLAAGNVTEALESAIALATNCHRVYLASPPKLRRALNQALYDKLYLHGATIAEAQLAEPFDQIIHRTYTRQKQGQKQEHPELNHSTQGSNVALLAEGVGFEPTEPAGGSAVFKTAAFVRSAIPPSRKR